MKTELQIDFADHNVQCRIPHPVEINGDFKSTCGVLVEGVINGGAIQVAGGPLIVLQQATVKGRIHVKGDVYLLGIIESEQMTVEGVVHVASTGKLSATCRANEYKTYAGSVLSGNFALRASVGA